MQSETAIARKIQRLQKEIDLLRQVIRAYEDLVANPTDFTTGVALGSAKAALEHHERNGRQIEQFQLDGLENLPAYDPYSVRDGRMDDGDRGQP